MVRYGSGFSPWCLVTFVDTVGIMVTEVSKVLKMYKCSQVMLIVITSIH